MALFFGDAVFFFNFAIIIRFCVSVCRCTLFSGRQNCYVCVCYSILYPLCCNNDAYKFGKHTHTHIDKKEVHTDILTNLPDEICLCVFLWCYVYLAKGEWEWRWKECVNTHFIMGSVYLPLSCRAESFCQKPIYWFLCVLLSVLSLQWQTFC